MFAAPDRLASIRSDFTDCRRGDKVAQRIVAFELVMSKLRITGVAPDVVRWPLKMKGRHGVGDVDRAMRTVPGHVKKASPLDAKQQAMALLDKVGLSDKPTPTHRIVGRAASVLGDRARSPRGRRCFCSRR
jgi:hypothetical protein